MRQEWYFISSSETMLSDAYKSLVSVRDVRRIVLPRTWTAGTKRHEIVHTILGQLRYAWTLLVMCAKDRYTSLLICADHHYSALLVSRVLRLLGKNIRVYLIDFYLHELGGCAIVKMIVRALLSSRVAILVQAPDDAAYFRNLNGRVNIAVAPFALPENAIPCFPPDSICLGDYVFVGGRSNRDHRTVIKAAEMLPHIPFVVVASKRYSIKERLPENVHLLEDIPSDKFHNLLAGSRCVVLSLKENIGSSGQMVALAAMHYGKLVLYSDMPAISQYFDDGKTGIAFRTGDFRNLVEKLSNCFPNSQLCEEVGQSAKRYVEAHQTRDHFLAKMVSHLAAWAAGSDSGTDFGHADL
jgi:glycosyltransferase involved in cell wall biosynthesis